MSAEVLDVTTVPAYLATRPGVSDLIDLSTATVQEVGDGNLNLVFVVRDAQGRSLVVKQSLPYVRMVGESWPLSQDRILAEGRGYVAAQSLSPELTPAFHGLDAERRVLVLEDLSSWTVWRRSLNDGVIDPGAGAAVGTYAARIAFGTSVLGRRAEDVQEAAAGAANPELCRITEDLVFTEPFIDHEQNAWDDELTADVLALRDPALLDEVAALKFRFLTAGQALIHGDLHSGSVFVPGAPQRAQGAPAAKVFDIEFAFYGPVGFDLGTSLANHLFAHVRAEVLDRPADFRTWVAGLPAETWDAFVAEIGRLWPQRADASWTDGFRDAWIDAVWQDAVGFAGLEAIRRVVGLAKVSDLQTLGTDERVRAARAVLRTARGWITDRTRITGPGELLPSGLVGSVDAEHGPDADALRTQAVGARA
ncbi:S-methyl-5-thioribose kinase [Cellulomonas soli]|uniref:Methylthioribose kinase n=1 Tax=Cellulomonas soli TaxID=931535 RepID=A0A512PFZ7_9CELL|nr:S-methyl-5-thioribose kinase [Cellulomonas soli]NYI59732.1 5-methylthioribose kinase [Cellulomonas soli]GEP70125.1 methylthioribose kinase [Cellulomonas soli]